MTEVRDEAGRAGSRNAGAAVGRETDFDGRSASFEVARGNVSSVFLDDSVADAEPKARALAYALGGVERIEDAVRLLDAGAGILEFRDDSSLFGVNPDLQSSDSCPIPAWRPRHC